MRYPKQTNKSKRVAAGFSLIETMMAVLILTLIVGATFDRINKAQTNYRTETQKLDFTEQQRTFIDQFTRDLHQAGYPNALVVGAGAPANSTASSTVTVTSTSVTMEGDLDGSGNVQVVTYDYNSNTGCLERTVSPKGGAAGTTVVMVDSVLAPPANSAIFSAYDAAGNTPPVGSMKSVGVTFTLRSSERDENGRTRIQTTMTAMARMPNL